MDKFEAETGVGQLSALHSPKTVQQMETRRQHVAGPRHLPGDTRLEVPRGAFEHHRRDVVREDGVGLREDFMLRYHKGRLA